VFVRRDAGESLQPLPAARRSWWTCPTGSAFGFTDPRHSDIASATQISRPSEVRNVVRRTVSLITAIRSVLDELVFLEVKRRCFTALRWGTARPFRPHHNASTFRSIFAIADELIEASRRGGFDRGVRGGPLFPQRGIDRTHNPVHYARVLPCIRDYGMILSWATVRRSGNGVRASGMTSFRISRRVFPASEGVPSLNAALVRLMTVDDSVLARRCGGCVEKIAC